MDTVAVTDHGNMFGAIDLYTEAKAHDIKLIFGCETYVAAADLHDRTNRRNYHLVLLAENEVGYKNLSYLNSMGYLEGFYYNPRVDKALLRERHEGIIAMSACLGGEVAQTLAKGSLAEAENVAREYQDIFGAGNFFLELMPTRRPSSRSSTRRWSRWAPSSTSRWSPPTTATTSTARRRGPRGADGDPDRQEPHRREADEAHGRQLLPEVAGGDERRLHERARRRSRARSRSPSAARSSSTSARPSCPSTASPRATPSTATSARWPAPASRSASTFLKARGRQVRRRSSTGPAWPPSWR
jgi:hypothetical protein